MLVARKIDFCRDKKLVIELLRKNNIDDQFSENDIIYILEEDENVIGICKITKYYSDGVLSYILISKERRGEGLGDGLLRASLNYCLINGINEVYYIGENDYLIKEGFRKLNKEYLPEFLEKFHLENVVLICNINEFFGKGCPSCKRS